VPKLNPKTLRDVAEVALASNPDGQLRFGFRKAEHRDEHVLSVHRPRRQVGHQNNVTGSPRADPIRRTLQWENRESVGMITCVQAVATRH
jgi:hypothetical protein